MRITVIAVGQRQPSWASTAVRDYLSRFPRDFPVEVKEVKAEPRSGQIPAKTMAAEAVRIRKNVPRDDVVVALDEHGLDLTTAELAEKISRWSGDGRSVSFVIGGADGLDPGLKRGADMTMRISSMTLPHALARVLLCEQIYRVWSILHNHPYHRA